MDIKISGADDCGNLVVRSVGLVSQSPTADSTVAGAKYLRQGKIGHFNILEHKWNKANDGSKNYMFHTIEVFTNNIHFIGKYSYRVSVELEAPDSPFLLHKRD